MAVHSFHCLLFLLFIMIVSGQIHDDSQYYCREERCDKNGPPIRFPFRLNNSQQPSDCGYPGFTLFCEQNRTFLKFPISITRKQYLVKKIDYQIQQIELHYQIDIFELLPYRLTALLLSKLFNNRSVSANFPFELILKGKNSTYILLDCSARDPVPYHLRLGSPNNIIQAIPTLPANAYFFCTKIYDIDFPDEIYQLSSPSLSSSRRKLRLSWSKPDCRACEAKHGHCKMKNDVSATECFVPIKGKSKIFSAIKSKIFTILASVVSGLLVIAAISYRYFLSTKKNQKRIRIEMFLEDYFSLKPSRYTYADIKKITNNLKDKLGQGSYGTVFRGKLSNEVSIAVKILNTSKGNGEEFINEVATMGQIHHVNIVRLVGYCAEGLTRALVYEFLPNGSLEKYILPEGGGANSPLSWETLQDIALGLAKGIEYLHQGCDQRILHFDIKPQNVLLDQNFVAKISDFGLAKLCSKDQSLVSLTTARGTMGYIAPEVLTRNFGSVSYKSDVYSFGMLLLEMVGGKKSSVYTNNTDEVYYPEWIYNILEEGEDLRIDIDEEGDAKIVKKLAIVGLWCIQWHPVSRPTMKAVVQMLESGGEGLTMPPNPFVTGTSRQNTKLPPRRMALELEAISE